MGKEGENENIIKEKPEEKVEMHSEIYGVNKGHVYERNVNNNSRKTTNTTQNKKIENNPKSKTNIGSKGTDKKNIKGSNIGTKYAKGKTNKK